MQVFLLAEGATGQRSYTTSAGISRSGVSHLRTTLHATSPRVPEVGRGRPLYPAKKVTMDLSLGNIIAGGFISLIGLALLMYGRKEVRVPHLAAGVVLIVYPYFIGIWWLQILIAVVILGGLSLFSRLGY